MKPAHNFPDMTNIKLTCWPVPFGNGRLSSIMTATCPCNIEPVLVLNRKVCLDVLSTATDIANTESLLNDMLV